MAPLPPSMPHPFLLTTLLLISHLAAHNAQGRAVEIFAQTIPDGDLRSSCALTLGGFDYDLCPLVRETVVVQEGIDGNSKSGDDDRGEGPSSGRRVFELNLGGLAARQNQGESVTSAAAYCDEDTWVCLINKEVSHAREIDDMKIVAKSIPIARKRAETKDGITATLGTIAEHDGERTVSSLRLSMTGGLRSGLPQAAEIVFHCSDAEGLRYLTEDHGLHYFIWETRHACPKTLPRSAPSTISITEETEDNPGSEQPPPDETEKGEDDLMPPQGIGKIRKFVVIALVTLLLPTIYGFILFSSTRARNFTSEKFNTALLPFLSKVAIKLRPIGNTINTLTSHSIVRLKAPFRQGEDQLVRWAQEDMILTDSEDLMVNGSLSDDGWDADGLEEYIPLTVNPKHGRSRRVRSYGATPDVETFAERGQGILSARIGKYFKR